MGIDAGGAGSIALRAMDAAPESAPGFIPTQLLRRRSCPAARPDGERIVAPCKPLKNALNKNFMGSH